MDEYQDTDPAQVELLKLVAGSADELVLIGDPDQAIYAFRGAEQSAMADIDLHFGSLAGTVRTERRGQLEFSAPVDTVTLPTCWRSGPALLDASRRVASRLAGSSRHRKLRPAPDRPAGRVTAAVFGSASHEASYLASLLRRAHAEDGVPWSQMAVLVRSAGPAADTLRRGLAAADVPVGQPVQGALTDDPVVAHLLDLLLCVADPKSVTADDAEALLVGAVGRADPLQILRMRRHLRRVPDGPLSLAELITEPAALGWVPQSARAPVQRVRAVIEAGTDGGRERGQRRGRALGGVAGDRAGRPAEPAQPGRPRRRCPGRSGAGLGAGAVHRGRQGHQTGPRAAGSASCTTGSASCRSPTRRPGSGRTPRTR